MSSDKMEKISIFGLGWVGSTTAKCFNYLDHTIYGVDIDPEKAKLLKDKIIVTDFKDAIDNTDMSFICVPTPCKENGDVDLSYVETVCKQIREYDENQIIVIKSTVFPNHIVKLERILKSNWAINPEFLREASAEFDFMNPPFIIVGSRDLAIGKRVMDVFDKINAKKYIMNPEEAQMIKYVCNAWHGCKVVFTNEVGNICNDLGIDGDEVMKIFCEDTKLNISTNYHRIGEPYGGHCLPKDLSVLQYNSDKTKNILIDSISKSNDVREEEWKKNNQ